MHWTINRRTLLPLFTALVLCLAYVAGIQLIFGIRYEVNDDAIISNIASGAYGGERWRLVYVNILFGFLLRPLYWLAPTLNWFVLVQMAGGVTCFTLLGALLMRRVGFAPGAVLFGILLWFGGFDIFSRFHYVKYGGLFVATGLALLWLYMGRLCSGTILGSGLLLLGSMLRFDILPAVAALALGVLATRFIALAPKGRKAAVITAAVLLALVVGAKVADWFSYQTDEGWSSYTEFNAARTQLSDYLLPNLTDEQALDALDISANDLDTLKEWSFYDPEVFPTARVNEINKALPSTGFATALRRSAGTGARMLFERPENLFFAAALLGWLLLTKRKHWPAVLATLAALGAEVLYLHWRGRYPERIGTILVVAAALFLLLSYGEIQRPKLKATGFVAALLALASLPALQSTKAVLDDYWASRPVHAAQFDRLSQDKNTLYLTGTVLVDAANGYDVFKPRPEGYFSNIVFVGSWLMYAPPQQQALQSYGLQNPYRDALDADNVRIADYYHAETKENYLQEHYAPNARLLMEEEYLELRIFRVSSSGE